MSAAALMLLLPDFAVEPRRRERESEEQRPLFCPGSDPAAERQESNYYTAPSGKQTVEDSCAGHSLTLQQLNEKTSWTFVLSAFQESPPSTSRLIQTDEGRTCSGRSPAGPGKRRVLGW